MSKTCIVAAVDLQHAESDHHVAAEAIALAKSHDADLHLVFVIPDEHHGYVQNYVPKDMKAQVAKDATDEISAFARGMDKGDIVLTAHIRRGSVYNEIIRLADDIGADFVVVGANRPGLSDFFIGPNAARVARHAQCSVLVVRPPRNSTPHT